MSRKPKKRTTPAEKVREVAAGKQRFLNALAESGNIGASAKKARVPRRTVYDWRASDPDFASTWDAAVELGVDALEDEATRRAKDGTLRPVFQGKEHVGDVREFSDTLLIFLLKGRRPGKFKDRIEAEHTGRGGSPLFPVATQYRGLSDDELERRIAALEGGASPPAIDAGGGAGSAVGGAGPAAAG